MKRRFPDDPKREEEPIKQFVMDSSLMSSGDQLSGVQTPTWMKIYLKKLPGVGVKAARGDTVDAVMHRLKDWNIPDVVDILLWPVCCQRKEWP